MPTSTVRLFPFRYHLAAIALTIGTALTPAAFAQHTGHTGAPAASTPSTPSPASAAAPSHDMKSMMKDMNDQSARMPMTGDADIDFAMMMRIHHLGAIDMAQAQLRDGKNPQMRKLARDIIAAQNKEIAVFDKFLASKGHGQSIKK